MEPRVSQHTPVVTGRRPGYRLLQGLVRAALGLLTRYEVEDRDHYPATGPYLIVFNHLHWLDIPVVFATLRHEVAAVVGAQLRDRPLVNFLARSVGNAIFVQPGKVDPRSLAVARSWVDGGGVLLISPEGRRSPHGLVQAMRGTAHLAARTGAPIVPVAAWGQERAFPQLRRLRRPSITVRIGPPFVLPGTPNQARGAELDAYTDALMTAIAALLPEEYRGSYGQAEESV